MRTTDQPEQFQPLGPPMRNERAPEPTPVPVAPGIVRDPDGTLRTIIPPPSAPAPALRPMQTRDRMPGDVTYTSNIPRHERTG